MLRSLQSGISGLRNHQIKLDVVGNNIANINTVGFKRGRINFADTISLLLRTGIGPRGLRGGINPTQVGLGMKVQSIDTNFAQGTLDNTGFSTDLAIRGRGFFVVKQAGETFYTRAGNFTIDSAGNLVAGGGSAIVQGYVADEDGDLVRSLTDIVLPLSQKTPPKSTSEVSFYSNLDARATESDASLVDVGTSGVTSVSGMAENGVGGTHTIDITGANAIQSISDGTNSSGGPLTLSTSLSAIGGAGLGVSVFSGLEVVTDQGTGNEATWAITGLDSTSTVGDLLNALNNQTVGSDYALVGGEIRVTRDYAGAQASYSVTLQDTGTCDIAAVVFTGAGQGVQDTFTSGVDGTVVTAGSASTLVAVDSFADSATNLTSVQTLSFVADSLTGLMTELEGLGNGGVSIRAAGGFAAATAGNELIVSTDPTNHATSIDVYDSQGNIHTLTMTFTKTSRLNEWKWEATVPEPAQEMTGNTGVVSFTSEGSMRSFVYGSFDGSGNFTTTATEGFRFDPGYEINDTLIVFNPGTIGEYDGITQTSAPFTTKATGQDGYGMGTLEGINIDVNGGIRAYFSNGVEKIIAAVVLADFTNEHGLMKVGDNQFRRTEPSGEPLYGLAEDELGSAIESMFLEQSNVDLVQEFTEMIMAQRGFQANAKTITTSDQILQEVINLKR